ncbi:MAG: hypothetical protein JSS11_08895 [Verrucomicrobia bacterium]|nr:hypothetical protein [Verrucomicrobiota bacterium]
MQTLATPDAPHLLIELVSLDPAAGVLALNWLAADSTRVDSGGSIARFTPVPIRARGRITDYATPDDTTLIDAILHPAPVQMSEPRIYAEQLGAGYAAGPTGLKLKATERAQPRLSSQLTLIQVALAVAALTMEEPQPFFDFDDAPQTLPTDDFLALMLRYGLHC